MVILKLYYWIIGILFTHTIITIQHEFMKRNSRGYIHIMPVWLRYHEITMSPELVGKVEAASKTIETAGYQSEATGEPRVSALELTRENSIVLVDKRVQGNPNEHVIFLDTVSPENAIDKNFNEQKCNDVNTDVSPNDHVILVDLPTPDNVDEQGPKKDASDFTPIDHVILLGVPMPNNAYKQESDNDDVNTGIAPKETYIAMDLPTPDNTDEKEPENDEVNTDVIPNNHMNVLDLPTSDNTDERQSTNDDVNAGVTPKDNTIVDVPTLDNADEQHPDNDDDNMGITPRDNTIVDVPTLDNADEQHPDTDGDNMGITPKDNTIVDVSTLDNADEQHPDIDDVNMGVTPKDNIIVDVPTLDNTDEQEQGNEDVNADVTPKKHLNLLDLPTQDNTDTNKHKMGVVKADINKDGSELDTESSTGLFEVSVDISENDSDEQDTPILGPPQYNNKRRASRWSATVLFLASEVQMMVNLAQLSPPEGYEMAPKRKKGTDDDDEKMSDRDSAVELQPMDGNDTNSDNAIAGKGTDTDKEYSNGAVIPVICDNSDLPPPYENLDNGCGGGDDHSLISDKSVAENEDKDVDEDDVSVASDAHPPHEDWGHKADFLLAVIGYAVDLSNVWRFPYLCYRNGGGAFIIPYFTVLIFGALPIFFMELCLGQFHREGPITVWKIAPLFKGIGYASCFMSYVVAFYYNVVIGWAFYYLFSSFTLDLPWRHCDREWNSPHCWQLEQGQFNTTDNTSVVNHTVSSSYEFFERRMLMLHLSNGLENLGGVRWELVLCTLLTFICLYFSLWKGVKSSGKVVYVTATMPYLILLILLIRGCLLPGAINGIKYFITPNLERLGDPQVWIDAAVQIMFSIGAGFGTHIAYASHNKFNNNCYADCLFTAAVNSFTSIFSGFVVFSYLGYMADRQHKHIDKVAQEGPGLVFIVYPEAIATLPGSSAWAIIFFIMLITLGMDSAFGGLESPLTGLSDRFYGVLKTRYYREILTFLVIASAFLFSIPCNTWGGMYVFKILDTFAAGTSIVFTVLCQVVAVSWFYGIDQFCKDINQMIGFTPGLYWRICWKYLSPAFLLVIVISSFLHYAGLEYEGSLTTYTYPTYANGIGWLIAGAPMSIIPLYALYYILTSKGTLKQRISLGISPRWEHKEIREKQEVKRFKREHWVYI